MTKPLTSMKINDINILIVEDEIVLAMALEVSLNKMGFNVSGIDVANVIWNRFKIPIVFLTSYTNDNTINKALECEPYGYLIKPCRDEELKATINTALHKHRYFFKRKNDPNRNDSSFLYLEDNLKFDKTNCTLYKNSELIKLTKNEKKLFNLIANTTNHTASFENIFAYIWREDIYDLGKLRTLIYRLKLKTKTNLFENIFEQGYRLKVKKID